MLPRILFITAEPPHTAAAGAIVFHRLFQDYPSDRLLVVTNSPPPPQAATLDCVYRHLPLLADRAQRTRFWPWRNRLSALGAANGVRLQRVHCACDDFRPEVVATLMQDSWYYSLAARYAHRQRLPLLLFVHDLPHLFEPVPRWLRARQLARDAGIARQAAARLFISPGMRDWFRKNADVDGEVCLPPRSPQPVAHDPAACQELKHAGQLTLGYAGGLHYGYGEQLLRLLPILRETRTRVECFGPLPSGIVAPLRAATEVFHFNGSAPTPEEAWRRMIECCDVVLQPYLDPPGPHELQYRTHFPSKLGDALSTGLPLLITGPQDAAGVAWCAARADVAALATDTTASGLISLLSRLRNEGEWRVALARNAQAVASAFDVAPLRSQLRGQLRRLVGSVDTA